MKIDDRIITNNNCDYPNKVGTVVDMSETGVCLVIKLDDGLKILTMDYAVDLIN